LANIRLTTRPALWLLFCSLDDATVWAQSLRELKSSCLNVWL
jgi:hypothetical protein